MTTSNLKFEKKEDLIADALVNAKRHESVKIGHVNLKKMSKELYFTLQGGHTEEKQLVSSKC
jgi:hypothetical protein